MSKAISQKPSSQDSNSQPSDHKSRTPTTRPRTHPRYRPMVQAIQDMTKKVSQFGEDLEKLKCLSTYKINTSQSDNNGDVLMDKAKPYKKTVRCFHCNKEGHMRFQCPDKDDISESRRRHKSRLFRNSENTLKTRVWNIPPRQRPRSEVSVALEAFLDEFETLFCEEGKEDHEVEGNSRKGDSSSGIGSLNPGVIS